MPRQIDEKYAIIVPDADDMNCLLENGITAYALGNETAWRMVHVGQFKGKEVVILRKNDSAGDSIARMIRQDLAGYAFSVRIVNPSGRDHGGVGSYLTLEGGSIRDIEDLIGKNQPEYAPWVQTDLRGNVKGIYAGILADTVRKNGSFITVRNQQEDKDRLYCNRGGVYCLQNKPSIKAHISEYIPVERRSDNLLNNVANLMLATNEGVHEQRELDAVSRFINFPNGLLDIENKALLPHREDILSTFQHGFEYKPGNNKREVFEKFVRDLCTKPDGSVDEDEILALQEYTGLILSNMPMEKAKKALVLYGRHGNSGKSVYLRMFTRFFGMDRVASIKLSELTPDNRFILGQIAESRLIACGDESATTIKDSSTFKSLTGGDPVKVEQKGRQGFSYIYRGGIVICCNELPFFEDDRGDHLFERLLILPCEHSIPEGQRDPRLDEKLAEELPGIFDWGLEGLYRLMDNNFVFTKSESSERAVREYRVAGDNVYRFIMERYEITGSNNDRISKREFEDEYHRWASADKSIHKVERKNIQARLESYGITSGRGNVGDKISIYVYRGLKRKEPDYMEITDDEDCPFT